MGAKEKVKVGFLYKGDPTNTRYWSGSISRMHSTLSKSDIIELKDVIITQSRFYSILYKLIKKLPNNKNHFSYLMLLGDSIKANRLIEKSGCEWIFAPACSNLVYLGRKTLKNKKVIYLSDATYHKMLGYYYEHSLHDQKIGHKWEETAQKLAHTIIYPSKWPVDDAVGYYHTSKEKIDIVKFGANLDDYGAKIVENGKDKYRLLLVGVDYVRKGVDIAIEAVKLLNESSSSVKYELSIVGLDKPKGDIPDYVTFYGKLRKNREDELKKLVQCYSSHDIFLMPTKAECAGIVFAEAAMFGLPSITYATGGVPDYIEEGITGRCLDTNCTAEDFCNAIRNAVEGREISSWSVNARKKYEKELNWDNWLEQFEKIIK